MGYYIVTIDEINIKLKRFSSKPAVLMRALLHLGESKQTIFKYMEVTKIILIVISVT
jgi:hypothetical protein